MEMANYDGILKLLAITICSLIVDGKLLETLEDRVVMTNDSIRLSCRSDIMAEIQWHRRGEYLYAGGKFYTQDKGRLQMETDQTSTTYTLVIREARSDDAGAYKCIDDEGRGDSSSANLTVMNSRLLCESNMHANGYIGPNTCNLQQENLTFSCSVSFNGTSPRLMWRASNEGQLINSSFCDRQPNQTNCRLTLKSDPLYDGTVFTCQTAQPGGTQYNCSTRVIKVQYFALDHELKPVEKIVDEEVECSVRSNLDPGFKWSSLSEDNQERVVSDTRSHVIQKHGLYWCNVSYSIGTVQCSSTASVIYARKSMEPNSWKTATIILIIVVILAVVIFVLVVCWVFRHYKISCTNPRTACLGQNGGKEEVQEEEVPLRETPEHSRQEQENEPAEVSKEKAELEKEKLEKKLSELEKKLFQPLRETVPYAENPELVKTIVTKASERKRAVYGIAILKDELFTVSRECKEMEVFGLNDLKCSETKSKSNRVHKIDDLQDPRDLASCSAKNCLYVRNYKEVDNISRIFRVSPDGKVEVKWEVKENTGQISVGNNASVFVAVWNGSKVMEYTCDGELVREIKISKDASIDSLRHVISLQSGYFALCHGERDDENHRVCIVGDHGRLIKSFGGKPTLDCSETQLYLPGHLARDEDDAIIVADRMNRRVLLLTPQLEFKRELIKGNDLANTWRVCLDMKRGYLFVADNEFMRLKGHAISRILVYNIIKSNTMEGTLQAL